MKFIAISLYSISLVAQLGAVLVAMLAYSHVMRYRTGWLMLATGLGLMLGRRLSPIFATLETGQYNIIDATLSVPISILLFLGVLTIKKIVIDLNASKNNLSKIISVDYLTGASSRLEIFKRCEIEIDRSRRTGHSLAILEIDIDHFKKVNDQYGHATGDKVLSELTKCCLKSIRDIDSYGRIGGEEFLILLPETDLITAQTVAERLRNSVQNQPHQTPDGNTINITVSIGIALFNPLNYLEIINNKELVENLINQVDHAMYRAKNNGKNCVAI